MSNADASNPGTMVVCVNASESQSLQEGKTYKVRFTKFAKGRFLFKLVGVQGYWAANRFVKEEANEKPLLPNPR